MTVPVKETSVVSDTYTHSCRLVDVDNVNSDSHNQNIFRFKYVVKITDFLQSQKVIMMSLDVS